MRHLVLSLLLLAACTSSVHKPSAPAPVPAPAKTGAKVMILGLYHFDNPGLDVVKTALDDHTSAKRQAEIADVVARLAAFRPTVIAVEWGDQATLDEAFAADRPLDPSETEQLGFRLARQLGLPGLVAIDHKLDMDFDRLMAAATASNDQVFLTVFQEALKSIEAELAAQVEHTVRDNLIAMNDPARIARDRALYLQMARVRHEGDYAGPDVLSGWYQRNFRIFANLAAAIDSPEARVLVLYGAGHAAILRDLVEASPNLVLVEPNDYLGSP
jgi:hypothetical protein